MLTQLSFRGLKVSCINGVMRNFLIILHLPSIIVNAEFVGWSCSACHTHWLKVQSSLAMVKSLLCHSSSLTHVFRCIHRWFGCHGCMCLQPREVGENPCMPLASRANSCKFSQWQQREKRKEVPVLKPLLNWTGSASPTPVSCKICMVRLANHTLGNTNVAMSAPVRAG